jgi:hypothetical protein
LPKMVHTWVSTRGWALRQVRNLTNAAAPRAGLVQNHRVFEVWCVEAFGELAVDLSEQVTRLAPPTLLAPQPGETSRGTQFEGFRLLPPR